MQAISETQAHYSKWISITLLIILGLIWGSGYSIAHFATTHGVPSLGYTFWQSLGPAILLLIISTPSARHRIKLSPQYLRFYFITGLFGIALPNSLMYLASPHLPAGLLAVMVNTVPIFTYLFALMISLETFSWARGLAIMLSIAGLMLLNRPSNHIFSAFQQHWSWLVLLVPISFASMAIFAVRYRPKDATELNIACGMLVCSSIYLAPITLYFHDFYTLTLPWQWPSIAVVSEIILSTIGYIILFRILKTAGAVFYSFVGSMVAITGLVWGYIFFGETLSKTSAFAATLIILGIFIVSYSQPKQA